MAVRVLRVIDGDTLEVETRRALSRPTRCRVRLFAIDAPEMAQPWGQEARDYLADRIEGADCRMRVMDMDRYQRVVAVVYRHRYGHSINLDMVRSGYAYCFAQYGSLPGLKRAENRARARRRGMWQKRDQTPPWEYRARRRARRHQRGSRYIVWLVVIVAVIAVVLMRNQGAF